MVALAAGSDEPAAASTTLVAARAAGSATATPASRSRRSSAAMSSECGPSVFATRTSSPAWAARASASRAGMSALLW
jgi:hypothetical protein